MRNVLVSTLLLLFVASVRGQIIDCYAIASGFWSNSAIWANGIQPWDYVHRTHITNNVVVVQNVTRYSHTFRQTSGIVTQAANYDVLHNFEVSGGQYRTVNGVLYVDSPSKILVSSGLVSGTHFWLRNNSDVSVLATNPFLENIACGVAAHDISMSLRSVTNTSIQNIRSGYGHLVVSNVVSPAFAVEVYTYYSGKQFIHDSAPVILNCVGAATVERASVVGVYNPPTAMFATNSSFRMSMYPNYIYSSFPWGQTFLHDVVVDIMHGSWGPRVLWGSGGAVVSRLSVWTNAVLHLGNATVSAVLTNFGTIETRGQSMLVSNAVLQSGLVLASNSTWTVINSMRQLGGVWRPIQNTVRLWGGAECNLTNYWSLVVVGGLARLTNATITATNIAAVTTDAGIGELDGMGCNLMLAQHSYFHGLASNATVAGRSVFAVAPGERLAGNVMTRGRR